MYFLCLCLTDIFDVILVSLATRKFSKITYSLRPQKPYARTPFVGIGHVFTKRCRLSWLTNSALVYEPKCGEVPGPQPMSTTVHRSPNKLERSNFIFNLYGIGSTPFFRYWNVISSPTDVSPNEKCWMFRPLDDASPIAIDVIHNARSHSIG